MLNLGYFLLKFHILKRQTYLSKETVFHRIDLTKINDLDVERCFKITANKSGILYVVRFINYTYLTDTLTLGSTIFQLRPYIVRLANEYELRK